MSSEWSVTTIGEQATLQRGFDITKAQQRTGTVPVVSSAGISSWHDTAMVKAPGVVLGRKGVVGSVHFVEQDFWPHDTSLWVKDFHGNDPRYVYYFFRGHARELSALDVGSANPTLNRNHVHPIEVPWPSSLDEQRLIAGILGSLDDRITLLRETNTTLEAIAQALFKSWFVDFDPVHAKMQGRAPEGMDEATAALFPDSFEESELGAVPKGWRVEWLSDVFDFKEGPGIRNWQYTNSDQGTRFINIRCIQNGDLSIETANRITDEEANGKYAHFHLQAWDVVVSTSGTLGRNAIVRQENLPLMLNTSVIRFRPIEGKTGFAFVYEYLNALEFLVAIESMASGSVQKNFGPMHLKQMRLVCPPFDLMSHFEAIATPLFECLVANRTKAQTLATLRDTLLPRMISGQLTT